MCSHRMHKAYILYATVCVLCPWIGIFGCVQTVYTHTHTWQLERTCKTNQTQQPCPARAWPQYIDYTPQPSSYSRAHVISFAEFLAKPLPIQYNMILHNTTYTCITQHHEWCGHDIVHARSLDRPVLWSAAAFPYSTMFVPSLSWWNDDAFLWV